MKLNILGLLFLLLPSLLYAQSWQWENPKPMGDEIQQVFFADSLNGWIVPADNTLLITTDGGKDWTTIYTNIFLSNIYFLNKKEGWGVGRDHFEQNISYNIYHTTNSGLNWEIQLTDSSGFYDVYFRNKLEGWAVNTNAYFKPVFHTSDGGKSWKAEAAGLFRLDDGGSSGSIMFSDSLKGFEVFDGALWGISTFDGGKTWQKDSTIGGFKIIKIDSLHLWILAYGFVTRSTDGGKSWTGINFPNDSTYTYTYDIFALDSSNIFISSDSGFFRSNDGGITWSKISSKQLGSLWFINNNEAWGGGVGYISGLFHSTDGGITWNNSLQRNYPFGQDDYVKVDFINKNTGWICIQSFGSTYTYSQVIKTTDGGSTWTAQNIKDNQWAWDMQMLNANTGYIVGNYGMIYKTTDGGENWILKNSGTIDDLMGVSFINEKYGWIVGRYVGENKGIILKTMDGGESWISQDSTIANLQGVCFIDSLTGWAASYSDYFSGGRIVHTTDGGSSWVTQFTGSFTEITFLDSLNGYALGISSGSNAHVYETHDGGKNWLPSSINTGSLQDMQFINKDTGYVVGFYGRIFRTTDAGTTWIQQPSYCNRYLFSVDFTDANNGWAVGSAGTVLHTTNGGVTFVNSNYDKYNLPNQFYLYQNYPNPFNPSTVINYQLSADSYVTLKIYDILGNEVKTLVNEYKPQGLARGIYFYRLIVNPRDKRYSVYSITKKMVYLK
ncbi:MAG: YCF48-related protein [Ignavibacteriaceae bacterium]